MTGSRLKNQCALAGVRVLAMMHPSGREVTHNFMGIIEAGKARWGWHVDVLCWPNDQQAFTGLMAPSGASFPHPNFLRDAEWEADPKQSDEIDRRLWCAESKANFPVGRLVASAAASIGRAYVLPARNQKKSPLVHRVLADNTEAFRIVRRIFAFADRMLETSKPDLIIATEWNTLVQGTVRLAAIRHGIPCVVLRRSKIHNGYDYWTTDPLMMNAAAIANASARRQSNAAVSEEAYAYIRRFREQPGLSGYVQSKWQKTGMKWKAGARRWFRLPVRFAKGLASDVIGQMKGRDQTQRVPLFERLIKPEIRKVQARRHRRFLLGYSDEALRAMKYVYFPMHKETDMPLSFQATPWQDQQNTVRMIASALPAGYRLLVREHRANHGQRPTKYYQYLSCLPNVVIVDAFDSQFKYIRNADLIVTENGSSGWEGLLLGRRVLTIADSFYDGAGLNVSVRDPNLLSTKILEMLAAPAVASPEVYDKHLGHMIDAEKETLFPQIPHDADASHAALDKLEETVADTIPERAERPEPVEP